MPAKNLEPKAKPTPDPPRSQMAGHVVACPNCGKKTFAWTGKLQKAIPKSGQLVIIKGLTGHKCRQCGLEALDIASSIEADREAEDTVPANYEVSLTRQGSRRAIFLNKDLARITNADDASSVLITPIDSENLFVHIVRGRRRSST